MKIAVIGLGLIGGSIFKRLQEESLNVIGISKSQTGENIYPDYTLLNECNIVFVCLPMSKTPQILEELSKFISSETIVTDVCSLKTFVANKTYPFNFIPSHPMAGTEFSGFENSFPEMFEGAKWIITTDKTPHAEKLETLIKIMGAEPIYTTPVEHDKAVAMISHVPMLIAQALFKTAEENPLAMQMASSGFRDSTRLAGSNPEMAIDMINLNETYIQETLLKIYTNIGMLLDNYDKEFLQKIAVKRREMYVEGKNVFTP